MERRLPQIAALPRRVFPRAESLPEPTRTRVHAHPWAQLSYATKGVLGVRTREGSYLAPPQRAIWIPQGIAHSVESSARTQMRSLYVAPAAAPFAAGPGETERCRVLGVTPLVRELIRAATRLPVDYDESGPDGRLVTVLLDRLALLSEARFSLPLPADSRLSGVAARLEERPDDDRGLEALAAQAGLSGRTMTRLFLRETGLSFRAWRRRLRLLASLGGLEAGKSVTAVALDCGYASTSAFIAAFRREFGASPRAAVPPTPPTKGREASAEDEKRRA